MKAVVRPFKSGHQEGFVRLRTLTYPRHDIGPRELERDFSVWRWLETHPLANQFHRWVLVTENQEVVGHLAATPQFYRINGQRVVAHTPADYMALPRYGFQALTLMREFFRTCENCVACDQAQEAVQIEKWMGAEEVGKLRYAAKLLDMTRLSKLPASVPMSIPRLFNRGLRVIDRALLSGFGSALEAKVFEEFDEFFDRLFENIAATVPCLAEKDAAFLRWRYGPGSPQAPVTVLGIRDEDGLVGYAVLQVTSRPPIYGYVLDLTTLPGRYDVAAVLLRESVEHFIQSEVYGIRYQFLESPISPLPRDLWRLGFFHERDPNTLLLKFADPNLHATACNPANWGYSAGDGEASFWVM
jgi:hypothetical protein